MNFHIETRDEEPRRLIKPPPNYQSRGFRLRLMMLFGMLILVLILMKEVRKPERWEWMGFENVPAKENQGNPDNVDPSPVPDDHGIQQEPQTDDRPLPDANPVGNSGLPVVSQDFWDGIYGKLGVERQRILFRLLRDMRTGKTVDLDNPEQMESYRELFELIKLRREKYNTDLIDRISFLDDKSKRKQELNEQLFQSRDDWENRIRPAFEELLDGNEIKVSQLNSIESLQEYLDQLALEQVVDRADMKRAAEGAAWLRCWERLSGLEKIDAPDLTQIELMGQPETYRGRPVGIDGWIRAARVLNIERNELGIEQFFELWLRPKDTNQAPYCVYVRQLPLEFPAITEQMQEMNERIEVDGLFFKIRSYEGSDGQVRECPLILAKSFTWNPVVTKEEKQVWMPPWWAIITFFVAMPLVATLFAWSVYRNTQMRHFEPGAQTKNRISDSLTRLKDDPEVKTDLEKIREMEEKDRE